jgi:hypothetical protein
LCFSRDFTATAAAKIVGINSNTADKYYNALREKIARASQEETKKKPGSLICTSRILERSAFAENADAEPPENYGFRIIENGRKNFCKNCRELFKKGVNTVTG